MKRYVLFLSSFLFLSVRISGQTDPPSTGLSQIQFINGISRYRGSLIRNIQDVMARLDNVSDSLKRVSEFPEQHDIFRHELKEKIIKSSHAGVHLFFGKYMHPYQMAPGQRIKNG